MPDQNTPSPGAEHKAGAFDIRNIIALLLGIYGVVLVVLGVFADQELGKTGGVNANLYAGIGMLVVAVAFVLWARLKPIVVSHTTPDAEAPAGPVTEP